MTAPPTLTWAAPDSNGNSFIVAGYDVEGPNGITNLPAHRDERDAHRTDQQRATPTCASGRSAPPRPTGPWVTVPIRPYAGGYEVDGLGALHRRRGRREAAVGCDRRPTFPSGHRPWRRDPARPAPAGTSSTPTAGCTGSGSAPRARCRRRRPAGRTGPAGTSSAGSRSRPRRRLRPRRLRRHPPVRARRRRPRAGREERTVLERVGHRPRRHVRRRTARAATWSTATAASTRSQPRRRRPAAADRGRTGRAGTSSAASRWCPGPAAAGSSTDTAGVAPVRDHRCAHRRHRPSSPYWPGWDIARGVDL